VLGGPRSPTRSDDEADFRVAWLKINRCTYTYLIDPRPYLVLTLPHIWASLANVARGRGHLAPRSARQVEPWFVVCECSLDDSFHWSY
jgi:hypothetical protein